MKRSLFSMSFRTARFAVGAGSLTLISLVALGFSAGSASAATPPVAPAAVPPALRPALYKALAKDTGPAYTIKKDGCATLPKSALKACFGAGGVRFAGAQQLALHLAAFGRGTKLAPVTAVQPVIQGNRVSYRHGNLTAWWRVLPMGFEQGFTIAKRPAGRGELTLALAASRQDAGAPTTRRPGASRDPAKNDIPTAGRDTNSHWIPASAGMTEKGNGSILAWGKLRYGKLVVTDAKGKVIPATLTTEGDRILIAVNDAHATYPLTVDPLVWLGQKVTSNDLQPGDQFGEISVAIDGTTALIGAPGRNNAQGAAYIFTKGLGGWSQTAELTASDGSSDDYFGDSVALDGTTAVVGAPDQGTGSGGVVAHYYGAAYVFSEAGGSWSQVAELKVGNRYPGDNFGLSVALDGTAALVGSPGRYNAQGAAYVFSKATGWGETAELRINNAAIVNFGLSVALDGTTALVSGFEANSPGAVYVFDETGGIWNETAKLTASDGLPDNDFGDSVALDGTTALIGADAFGQATISPGAAYVFNEVGSVWSQTAKLEPSDEGGATGRFGLSVALDGETALIGAGSNAEGYSAAYVFEFNGGSWSQTAEILPYDFMSQSALGDFSGALAISGTTLLFGGLADSGGNAYFYEPAHLSLTLSAPSSVGYQAHYTSQTIVTNDGTAATPLGVIATIGVPLWARFASATASQGSCSEANDPDSGRGTVTCAFGPVTANAGTAKASVTFTAIGNKGVVLLNTASVYNAVPALTASGATTIGNANHPPVAKNGTLTTKENAPASGTLEASDADGDPLTFAIVAKPGHGTVKIIDLAKGTYTYTPAKDFVGKDSFTFKANDRQADSNVATVSITVAASGGGSTVTITSPAGPVTFTTSSGKLDGSTASKPDGAPSKYDYPAGWFSFQITGLAKGATVSVTIKLPAAIVPIAYVECKNNATCAELGAKFSGNTVTLSLTDGGAGDTDGTANGVITDPGAPATKQASNHPPVASNGTLTTDEGKAASGTLKATDADGDALTFSIVAKPTQGSVTLNDASTGAYTYTPTSGYSGSDSFSFKANDGKADSNTATISITVSAASPPPSPPPPHNGNSGGGGGFGGLGLGLLAFIGLAALIRRRR